MAEFMAFPAVNSNRHASPEIYRKLLAVRDKAGRYGATEDTFRSGN